MDRFARGSKTSVYGTVFVLQTALHCVHSSVFFIFKVQNLDEGSDDSRGAGGGREIQTETYVMAGFRICPCDETSRIPYSLHLGFFFGGNGSSTHLL